MPTRKSYKRYRTFLIALYGILTLYFFQGTLYPSGGIVSQGVLLLFLLIGLWAFLKNATMRGMPGFMKIWMLFTAIQIVTFTVSPKMVYGVIGGALSGVATMNSVKTIFCFCFSLFIGYNIGKKYIPSQKLIANFGLLVFLLSIKSYFSQEAANEAEFYSQVTNNSGYNFISVIPFLPYIFRSYKKWAWVVVLTMVGFVISASKRGAIICLAIGLAYYALWYYKTHRIGVKTLAAGIIVFCGMAVFVAHQYSQNEYLQERMEQTEEGNSSGRDVAYAMLLDHWLNDDNYASWFFGNGSAQSIAVWGNYAHNDWLEILIDNGLFGVILYAGFFIGITRYLRRNRILTREQKLAASLIVLMWFLKTLFSMGYSSIWQSYVMIPLGMIIANGIPNPLRQSKSPKPLPNTPPRGV